MQFSKSLIGGNTLKKEPDKFVTLRMPCALHKALKEQAQKDKRTLSHQIQHYIEHALKKGGGNG